MMKKKILAAVLALCLLLSLSTVALAEDDGTEATAPVNGGAGASTGAATVAGDTFDVTDDDDATGAEETDPNDTDISLWGRITTDSTGAEIVYKIDVTWGTMRFVFTRPRSVWNPSTHTYELDNTTAGWSQMENDDGPLRPEYANDPFSNDYNRVWVTNHSNHAIKVTYEFTIDEGAFNATQENPNRVTVSILQGGMNYEIDGVPIYESVSNKLTNVDEMKEWKTQYDKNKVYLESPYVQTIDTAESFYRYGDAPNGKRQNYVFLVPSGTPDADKPITTEYTRLGTLTVTFEPDNERQDAYTVLNGIPRTP